jgi:hypothetical protein
MLANQCLLRTLLMLFPLCISLCASQATKRNAEIYPLDASQRKIPLAVCASSTSTLLRSGGISRSTRHNGNDGEAHFVLENKVTGTVLWKDEYVGEGICFGFNSARHTYVVGSRREHGIGVRLTNVRYIDEEVRRSRISAFNMRNIEAFAAVTSPTMHYVAFIALEGNDTSLFVIDVEKDVLTKLGRAPLPPPLTAGESAYVKEHPEVLEGPWGWMASFRDSYIELDPGIVQFECNDVVKVSYGADTAYERAKKRDVVKWYLGAPKAQLPSKSP